MGQRNSFLIVLLSLCLGINTDVLAQSVLAGVVKDVSGITLPGAVIEIPDLKLGSIADNTGHYRIEDIPNGKYIVVVSMLSYAKNTVSVSIKGGENVLDIILSESAIESKEVVITGQSKATEINRSPVPVVAINHQYLKENAGTNVINALAKVPGVSEVTTGPNVSKPFIRGLGYNRVLTLYDGMRQEGQQWGDEHGIEVDEYGVDRVELVKGPASLIYGSDAIAGVVNLIPAPPPPDGKILGDVSVDYQSNNNLIGGSVNLAGNKNGFSWQGRVSNKMAMDYTTPVDGNVYGTNFRETDANASLGWTKKWGSSHLDFSLYNDLQAIPDGSRDSVSRQFTKQITEADTFRPIVSNADLNTYKLPVLHQLVQHYRVMSSNRFNLFSGLMVVNAGFERSVRREYSHPKYGEIPGLYLQLNTYTYDIKYYIHNQSGWDFTAGINGMFQVNDVSKGTEFVIPSYHQFDFGPFVMAKKNIGKLDMAGGIRLDNRRFHGDALYTKSDPVNGFDTYYSGQDIASADKHFSVYDHAFSGLTYSLGLTYRISKAIAIKSNIARGFRAPNISEISANGVHPGTNIYQLGNPDFKPEFSLQEDIGLEFTSEHLSVNLAVFNNDISNYIYNTRLFGSHGQDSVIVPGAQTFQFQASNARLYGGEAEIDIHPHPLDWLHFENSISIVYGSNQGGNGIKLNDSEKYLPFIPPIHGTSELRANFKHPIKRTENFFVKIQAVIYANQDRVYLSNNTETPTNGYMLINAGIGTDIVNKKAKKIMYVSLFANNMADIAYQDHLNRLKYFEPYPSSPGIRPGIYNMGRNFGVKIIVPLG